MKLQKNKGKAVLLAMCITVHMSGCSFSDSKQDEHSQEYTFSYDEIYTWSEADKDTSTDDAIKLQFEDKQEVIMIEQSGHYLLEGECNGQIQIDAQDELVHLILKDVTLQSLQGPAVYVKSAAKVVITIPDSTNSIILDSAYYVDYTDKKACIFSEADLTINGGGKLSVYGYYEDAIHTKDTLKLLDVDLSVQAKDCGLRGNDGVIVWVSELDVQCEGTGIYTKKADKVNRGYVDIASGNINIIAGKYAIDAAENVYIHNCQGEIFGVVGNITCLGTQYIEKGCLE